MYRRDTWVEREKKTSPHWWMDIRSKGATITDPETRARVGNCCLSDGSGKGYVSLEDQAIFGDNPGKIELAQTYLAVPDVQSTCAMMNAFLNQVSAQRGKKLTLELADQLNEAAHAIKGAAECD